MKTKLRAMQWIAATAVLTGLMLSANVAFAQYGDAEQQNKSQTTEKQKQQKITGKLVFLHDYLTSEQGAPGGAQSELQREPSEQQRSGQSGSQRETSEQQRSNQPGAERTQQRQSQGTGAMGNLQQPVGIVADKSILLGLGSTQEFYLLTFDPNDSASVMAYQDAVKMAQSHQPSRPDLSSAQRERESATTQERSQSDRQPVRGERESDDPQREASQRQPAGHGELVEVVGKILKKNDIQAISITHVQKGTATPDAEENQRGQE